jgi:hypothetical protein
MLQNDPLRLPSFHFDEDADPDPAFHFDADPDTASQNAINRKRNEKCLSPKKTP